jgi:hypothetical protein
MLVRPLNNWLLLFFSTSQILNTKNENENGIFWKVFLTEVGEKKSSKKKSKTNNNKILSDFYLKFKGKAIFCTSSLLLDSFYKKNCPLGMLALSK